MQLNAVTPAPPLLIAPPQALAVFALRALANTDVLMKRRASPNLSPLLLNVETFAAPHLTVLMLALADSVSMVLASTDAENSEILK
jgi:hypothetical protein